MTVFGSRIRRALRGAAVSAVAALGLAACEGETAPPFEVEGEGTISGLLFFDSDRDGIYEPAAGDSALAGIPLVVRERDTDLIIAGSETTTDAEGRFRIEGLPAGTHSLFIDLPESVGFVCGNPLAVSVRINEVTSVRPAGQESCLVTIAEAREMDIDEPVTVRGVVTVGTGNISTSYFWIQDETAGIKIFMPFAAQAGQLVEVSGLIEVFGGELEISRGTVTVLEEGVPLPDPIVITGQQHVSSEFQGSLVTILGLTVTAVPSDQGGSYNVNVQAPDGAQFIIRVDSDAGITPGTFVVGNTYDVTGVVGPFGGAEQLYVRSNADIVPAT